MLTFDELPYSRINIDEQCELIAAATERLKAARSADEAIEVIRAEIARVKPVSTLRSICEVRYTKNTSDEFYSGEEDYYAQNSPRLDDKQTAFYAAMVKSPYRSELEKVFGVATLKNAELQEKTINEAALPLLAKEQALCVEYQKLQGSMTVEYEGKKYSVPQMRPFTENSDREVRRKATRAYAKAYAAKSPEFEDVYDRMVSVRTEIAHVLGFDKFTPVGYCRMHRNSYDENMVNKFREQVKKELVPLVSEIRKLQAKIIGISDMKFYDDAILSKNGNPAPVVKDEELYNVGINVYRDLRGETRELIEKMDAMKTFDLYSRENKMTGGYCTSLPQYEVPFIFANFNGTAGDVEVFTHEGGHAFADMYLTKYGKDFCELGYPSLETCECHSMSMEFLCWRLLDRFYGENTARAKLIHMLNALIFIPYGCMVDEFQHIVYNNPTLTKAQRDEEWNKLEKQYRPSTDYDGVEFYSDGRLWQRQLHIFTDPFYYIDYCLAQTVSLQFMSMMVDKSKNSDDERFNAAWEKYIKLVANSGKVRFVDTLEAAGLKSPFKDGVFTQIIKAAKSYMDENISIL